MSLNSMKAMKAAAVWAVRRPTRAISLVALIAVVLSCYPVIFLGKSFVSPGINGMELMYDANPTLPGPSKLRIENTHGADVGAMMWAFMPYGVIQHDAIFNHHELPLWNRYSSCGVPLLGQGMSMIEDPLHWIVIVADSAAWAWDVKFLAARFFFCFGAGLLALTATRHLGASVCVAASSAFIGFFFFRWNHPAILSLCYSPWILLSLLRTAQAVRFRTRSLWALVLVLAHVCLFNSGTVKEAFMLAVFLNGAGLFAILALWRRTPRIGSPLAAATSIGAAYILAFAISAPVLLTFARDLPRSFTVSDVPSCEQYTPANAVDFFDDIFWRFSSHEIASLPSVNFFILLGTLWAVLSVGRLWKEPVFLASALGLMVAGALAFGVVPAAVVLAVPVLRNILHVGSTLATVMIPLVLVVAAFGFRELLSEPAETFRRRWRTMLATLLGLVVLHLVFFHHMERGKGFAPVFVAYSTLIVTAVAVLPLAWRRAAAHPRAASMALTAVCLVALHARLGAHLSSPLDSFSPGKRVDLLAQSSSVDAIKAIDPDARVVGVGNTLHSGYRAVVGVEGDDGPDALMNPYFKALTLAADLLAVDPVWKHRTDAESIVRSRDIHDMMNVRWYAANGTAGEALGLPKVSQGDMAIYESPTAWPRAFFCDSVATYATETEFVNLVRAADKPFAATQSDPATPPEPLRDRTIVAARNYILTPNTTTFEIAAPGPGVAVLTEAYIPDDFIVTINGNPARYFRVNAAFKGVQIPGAGVYRISFSYWPKGLEWMLQLAVGGIIACAAWLTVAIVRRPQP